MDGKMTECTYIGAIEFDMAGQIHRVHAVASYDGEPWYNTVCGLAIQPYPPTGAGWDAVETSERCARCVAALAAPDR